MKIIKLDAINSTNEFLKEFIQVNSIKNNHSKLSFKWVDNGPLTRDKICLLEIVQQEQPFQAMGFQETNKIFNIKSYF